MLTAITEFLVVLLALLIGARYGSLALGSIVGIVLAFLISLWLGTAKETLDWNKSHPDDETAWTQSMFGGMPTITIRPSSKGDWAQPLYDLLLTGRRTIKNSRISFN